MASDFEVFVIEFLRSILYYSMAPVERDQKEIDKAAKLIDDAYNHFLKDEENSNKI